MDTKSKLIEIFKNTFMELTNSPDTEIENSSKANLASWDSGNQLILITCLEEEFCINIPDEAVLKIESFSDAFVEVENLLLS